MKKRLVLGTIAVVLVVAVVGAWLAYAYVTRRAPGNYFDSNGARLYYIDEGEGEPVILIHGFAVHVDYNWRKPGVLDKVKEEFRVIALDNRGHGLSQKFYEPSKYGLEMVEDIVRLMDHLGIEKAHVVGYSMGSFITHKLIATHPDRIMSAAPCGAGWEQPTEERLAFADEVADTLENENSLVPLLKMLKPLDKELPEKRFKQVSSLALRVNDAKALANVMRGMKTLSVTEQSLRENKIPVCSIVGSNDPLRVGVDNLEGRMANHETVYIEGGDHLNTVAKPAFADALVKFLLKHKGGASQIEEESPANAASQRDAA